MGRSLYDPETKYEIRRQQAWQIDNVGRDQYNTKYRIDALGSRSPSKAGLWVAGLGMLIVFAGVAIYAYPILESVLSVFQAVQSQSSTMPAMPSMELLPFGFFTALAGTFVTCVGIFMWIMSWRKRGRRR